MKILMINSVCGFGSTGRIVLDLCSELEKDGFECAVAYGRGNASGNVKIIKIGNKFDNYIHGFKTRIFDKHGFSSTRATKKFIQNLKDYNPDIIHLHNLHGYYLNIETLFKYLKDSNKKVIWTLHDCWAFTGHCSYFDYVGCSKWKIKCENCIQKNQYPESKIIDNSRWNYEKKKELFTSLKKENLQIVTPSIWLADLVKQSFLKKYSVKVINNGIDTSIFKPTESDFRDKYNLKNKFIILGVANIWTKRKGLDYFCQLSEVLDESYKIVLVGADKETSTKLPKNILSISRTSDAIELAQVYTAADIYVNPTLEDNYPTTNLEAISCGTPIITFDSGGSSECIKNSNFGISVKKADFNELVNSIKKARRNSEFICINEKNFNKADKYMEYKKIYTINMSRGR